MEQLMEPLVCSRVTGRTVRYSVGVWWPSASDYGGVESFRTLDEAKVARDRSLAQGYKHVDIWKTTVESIR